MGSFRSSSTTAGLPGRRGRECARGGRGSRAPPRRRARRRSRWRAGSCASADERQLEVVRVVLDQQDRLQHRSSRSSAFAPYGQREVEGRALVDARPRPRPGRRGARRCGGRWPGRCRCPRTPRSGAGAGRRRTACRRTAMSKPTPLSRTKKTASPRLVRAADLDDAPRPRSRVYFTALASRFAHASRSITGSPRHGGRSPIVQLDRAAGSTSRIDLARGPPRPGRSCRPGRVERRAAHLREAQQVVDQRAGRDGPAR